MLRVDFSSGPAVQTLERGVLPNWGARQAALKSVLLGTKPISPSVADIVQKYETLLKLNILRAGNVEEQYQAYIDGVSNNSKNRRNSRINARRRSSVSGSALAAATALSAVSGINRRSSGPRKSIVATLPPPPVMENSSS